MSTEAVVDVDASVDAVYKLWSQLDRFPDCFGPVKEVQVLDDDNAKWRVEVAGKDEEFTTRVTERIPGKRIAWTSSGSVEQSGVVTFHHLADHQSRVSVQLDLEDGDLLDKVAAGTGLVTLLVNYGLGEFKAVAERQAP